MPGADFEQSVFINCPFDDQYAPLLEAAVFCIVYFGFSPRLANERLEAGENRLEKIFGMIRESKFSIHDLSRCKAARNGEYFRMNMPFEFGIDLGFRRCGMAPFHEKKFLVFEEEPYDLKQSLSDIAGQDCEFHRCNFEVIIEKVRNFFRVESNIKAPGPSRLVSDYATFQGWMTEKKISEGHSERDAMNLPTRERVDEMRNWIDSGKPATYSPA
ncbi:MAG: hypothetical protein GEU87_11080 [Alphaproteobacteria bacterium]|nr:hypothetical protein [Alphaproteobacteria bacterium]